MKPASGAVRLAALAARPQVTAEDRLILSGLLELLDTQAREILSLHAVAGLRHWEIAALLQLPLPTVLSKYRRAVKKLQKAWEEAQ